MWRYFRLARESWRSASQALLRTRLMTVMAAIIYMAVFSVWLPKSLHSTIYLLCLSPFNALRKQPLDQPLICVSICRFLPLCLLPHRHARRHLRRFFGSIWIPETETSLRSSCTRIRHIFMDKFICSLLLHALYWFISNHPCPRPDYEFLEAGLASLHGLQLPA